MKTILAFTVMLGSFYAYMAYTGFNALTQAFAKLSIF